MTLLDSASLEETLLDSGNTKMTILIQGASFCPRVVSCPRLMKLQHNSFSLGVHRDSSFRCTESTIESFRLCQTQADYLLDSGNPTLLYFGSLS